MYQVYRPAYFVYMYRYQQRSSYGQQHKVSDMRTVGSYDIKVPLRPNQFLEERRWPPRELIHNQSREKKMPESSIWARTIAQNLRQQSFSKDILEAKGSRINQQLNNAPDHHMRVQVMHFILFNALVKSNLVLIKSLKATTLVRSGKFTS